VWCIFDNTAAGVRIAELRRLLARTHSNGLYEGKTLPFGFDAMDAVLPGGGLALGAVQRFVSRAQTAHVLLCQR
jgi:hypothetical protein